MYPHHNKTGTVLVVSKGPGPINALVLLDTGTRVIANRGNLQKET